MNKILELREKRKESQEEFARFLGVTQTAVSYWEQGKRTPPIKTLHKIAEKCNVSIAYLLGETAD